MAGDASIWTTLLAVIVGGAIGVSGSWIIERRKEKSERKRHRENKFEEAVTAVYEFDHWLDKYRLDTAIGKEQQMTSSPFAKLEGIVALHFPELSERTSTLASAAREYQLYLAQAGGKRLEGKIKEAIKDFGPAYTKYGAERNKLLDALKTLAPALHKEIPKDGWLQKGWAALFRSS